MQTDRRHYLLGLAGVLAGCSGESNENTTSRDTVEPRDATTTRIGKELPTQGTTTQQTDQATTTRKQTTIAGNTILGNVDSFENRISAFLEYDYQGAKIRIEPMDTSEISAERYEIFLVCYEYPVKNMISYSISDPIENVNYRKNVDLSIDLPPNPDADFVHYAAGIGPQGAFESGSTVAAGASKLAETDRFRVTNAPNIERAPVTKLQEIGSYSDEIYSRIEGEGALVAEMNLTTANTDWDVPLIGYKAPLLKRINTSYSSYGEYYENSWGSLASIIFSQAQRAGITDSINLVNAAVSTVRSLPEREGPGSGSNERVQFILETMIKGGGDTEDLALLLATILRSSPFGYGTRIVEFPNGFGVAVRGDSSIEGASWRVAGESFYYLEPTESGWGLGELPEVYDKSESQLHSF